jgi:hypothetical protein
MAGMDGNRTHQGHLNSALQTVLKIAGRASASVYERLPHASHQRRQSVNVRVRPQSTTDLAVYLAVSDTLWGS